MKFKDTLGKRCLFNDLNPNSTLFEAKVTEISPSEEYVKVEKTNGVVVWFSSTALKCIEILDQD